MVLRDASSDHERTGFFRTEDQIGEFGFVAELVDRETLVLLPEGPQLVANRPVEDRWHVDGDVVFPGPPEQRGVTLRASPEFPQQLFRRKGPLSVLPKFPQHRRELLLLNNPQWFVWGAYTP